MNRYIYGICISLLLAVSSQAQPVDTLGTGSNPPEFPTPWEFPVLTVPALPKNYVVNYTPLTPMTDEASVSTAGAASVQRSKVYLDGFGRSFQGEVRNISPGKQLIILANTGPYREQVSYLPYTSAAEGFRSDPKGEQEDYYGARYPEEGSTGVHAIGLAKSASDATKRSYVSYGPGKNNVGSTRGAEIKMVTNVANEVRIWTIGTGTPVSSAYYAAGELIGEEITDMHGSKSRNYNDKSGRLILKMQYEGSGAWISTQYIYDRMGRLRAILSPKAIRAIGTGGAIASDIWNNLCFQYYYDSKGRLSGELKPGEAGLTELVYDRKNRIVMRRSPLESSTGKWEVVFYDIEGRVKATGILANTENRNIWQDRIATTSPTASLATTNLLYYLCTRAGEKVYPTATISGLTYMSYSYYDDYSVASTVPLPYDAGLFSSEAIVGAEPVNRLVVPAGLPTLSKVRVLKDASDTDLADWTESMLYYDQKGRVVQSRGTNAVKNGSGTQGFESVSTRYNFLDAPVVTKHAHNNAKTGHGFTEETSYIYESGTARLQKTLHRMNGAAAWKPLATYTYDDMGRVQRKELGNNAEVQDYRFNIRDQLTGINATYAATGNKGGLSRSFGEQLFYDYGYTNPRYDGRIRGMEWRGSGGNKMQYGYSYDTLGRLVNADFLEYRTLPSPVWDKTKRDHTVSNIAYDPNGNMLRMQQRGMGMVSSAIVPVTMDNMSYTYETNSNRLQSVTDVVTTDYGNGDFKDGNTGSADYSYDVSGNLTKDLNKGITAITYTHFNKPQLVTFSSGNKVRYVYDASGTKLKEEVKDGSYTYKRDYIGNAIYRNDSLLYLGTEEGRTIYNGGSSYEEEYYVKDHIGNVRSVVSVLDIAFTVEYLATYELASAYTEGMLFDVVEEVRSDRPGATTMNAYSGMLSRDEYPVGTSVVLKVMAGDRIELGVDNMYEDFNPQEDNPMEDGELLDQILNTLLTGPGGTPAEGADAQLIEGLFNPQNFSAFINMTNGSMDSTKPLAALNYVLYDQQMQVVSSFTGRIQADGDGSWSTIGTGVPIEIPTNGYLAVFLTNKSAKPVFFDDLFISVSNSILKEENHYYPHGLPMGHIGSTAMGAVQNRVKHQMNEYIKDAGLNWMDFHFRQYDPQIGRFLGVDPLADYYGQDRFSPYAAMGNQPESLTDPFGLSPDKNPPGSNGNPHIIGEVIIYPDNREPPPEPEPPTDAMHYGSYISGGPFSMYSTGGGGYSQSTPYSLSSGSGGGGGNPNGRPGRIGGLREGAMSQAEEAMANHNDQASEQATGMFSEESKDAARGVANSIMDYGAESILPIIVFEKAYKASTGDDAPRFEVNTSIGTSAYWAATIVFVVVDPSPAGEAGLAKNSVKKATTEFTKSTMKRGREMHRAYKIDDVVKGVAEKEFRGIPGIRPDFVDFSTRTIFELKPFNPRAMKQGEKQLLKYKSIFDEIYPGTPWKTVLDTY